MGIQIEDPQALIASLCSLPRETDWVEFKENNFVPETVGKYVSALANSAIFHEKDHAYLVFGVSDGRDIVGTSVNIDAQKVGSDRFLFWLNKYLDPHISVDHHKLVCDGKQVELLCIDPKYQRPVRFKHVPYIRIDSSQQPLARYHEIERAIWQIPPSFERTP